MKRALSLLVVLALSCISKEAWLSGAHAIHFLEPDFLYEHEELSRKIFRDAQSSNEYHGEKVRHSTRVYLAGLPVLERFLGDARQRGIRLEPLAMRAVWQEHGHGSPESAAQLRTASMGPAPRLLRLNLDRGPERVHDDHLTVQLGRPLDEGQARWLWAQLPALRFATLEQNEAAMAQLDEAALRGFRPGFSTMRVASRFALWVGSTEQIRPAHEAAFRAQAEALADELLPQLEAALADPVLQKQLISGGFDRLVSLGDKLGRPPGREDLALFNPYGPLQDPTGMRVATEAGVLRVRLLFVERGAWGSKAGGPRLEGSLDRFLERLVMPRAQRDAEVDGLLHTLATLPEQRSEPLETLMRLLKDPALRSLGGQRGIDALARLSLGTGPDPDGMRKLAIENLRWLDVPERDRVYLSLLAARREEGVMSVISQSFAERPDDARIETLLSVWRDASRSEDSRMWAKNGLQTARNHCESSGLKALQLKIEKALASAP